VELHTLVSVKKGFQTAAGQCALLHDTGANAYLNEYSTIYFRINNNTRMDLDKIRLYVSSGFSLNSDDRLKYDKEDISGLSIIRPSEMHKGSFWPNHES